MPSEVKLYRVLLASPRDVADEREIVREEINRWNSLHSLDTKIVLLPVGWETEATPDLQARGQAIINRQLVDTSDLLIGIFWTRIGTPTPEAESGTVEEIERFISEGKRCIIYFSDKAVSPSKIDQQQYEGLKSYRQELSQRGLTGSFNNADEFRRKVFDHITASIQELSKVERAQLAAAQEARITEQAIGLQVQPLRTEISGVSLVTLLDAQTSIRRVLESKFSLQDIEEIKEREITNIQIALNSPELATLLSSQQPTTETVSAITQILESVTTPSMYAISSICKYGDDTSLDWLDLVGDWVERLGTRKIENGYKWASYIKTYPGLILLYASGLMALRSAKVNFLKEITERSIYSRSDDREFILLDQLEPRYVFYDSLGKLIEPGFANRFTPVSDHIFEIIKDSLYPNEEESRYVDWFDLFEFLLSIKSVQMGKKYPYFGSFTWRSDGQRMLIKLIQDAALGKGKYGVAIQQLLNGKDSFNQVADLYDTIASQVRFEFGRAGLPTYIKLLIESAEAGIRIGTRRELAQLVATWRQASNQ